MSTGNILTLEHDFEIPAAQYRQAGEEGPPAVRRD